MYGDGFAQAGDSADTSPVGVSTVESTFERASDRTTVFRDRKLDDVVGDKLSFRH